MQYNPPPSAHPGNEHWIVGPGAVGALFLANLMEKEEAKIRTWGRKSGLGRFLVDFNDHQHQFSTPLTRPNTPTAMAETGAEYVVGYLCVHASALEQATSALLFDLQQMGVRGAQLVVCSNGIFKQELLDKVLTASVPISCYRALLYFGATREPSVDGVSHHIQHKGGNRIVYGHLGGIACENFFPAQILNWFAWEKSSDIQKTEREKFLINFLLALYIGPRQHPNGSLFESVGSNDYALWLKHFSAVVKPIELSQQQLDASLRVLVAHTNQNINSLSGKWYAGESDEITQLIEDMRYLLSRAGFATESSRWIQKKTNEQLAVFRWTGAVL